MRRKQVVIIGGWAHTNNVLAPLVAALKSNFDIHVTSPAGLMASAMEDADGRDVSGDTPGTVSTESTQTYAMMLRSLIEQIGYPCSVIGWSMGGIVALETISRWPRLRVDQIVAVASTARFCAADGYPFGFDEKVLRAFKLGLLKKPEDVLHAFLKDLSFPDELPHGDISRKVETAMSLGVNALRHGLQYLLETDIREALAKIAVPSLVVHGHLDRIIPWQAGEFLSRGLTNSKFLPYESAGHNIVQSHTASLALHIRNFLIQA